MNTIETIDFKIKEGMIIQNPKNKYKYIITYIPRDDECWIKNLDSGKEIFPKLLWLKNFEVLL